MNPFYFGDSDKPLFGIYDEPSGGSKKSSCVLICNPIGHEYIRFHHASKNIASFLSSEGYHVLRFDYSCTGDSYGNTDEADVDQWIDDIATAGQELIDISGEKEISLIGARFGGTLAAAACEKYLNVKTLILWDPVARGDNYIDNMREMQRQMLGDENRFCLQSRESDFNENEFIGFKLTTKGVVEKIKNLDLSRLINMSVKNIIVISSKNATEYKENLEHYEKSGIKVNYKCVLDDPDWNSIENIETQILAHELPKEIHKFMTEV